MFTTAVLNNLLFADIETTSTTRTLKELPEGMQELWKERCKYLRGLKTNPENENMSDEELWEHKAPLHPEFGRVVGASFGKLILTDPTAPQLQINSIFGKNEAEILRKMSAGLEKAYINNTHTLLTVHNGKRFDIPYLSKRMIINNVELPAAFVAWNRKPWDAKFLDTSEVWSFGAWQESFTSLALLCQVLGVPTPKDDMSGKEVYDYFWNRNDIPSIETYCEKDIFATARVVLRMAGYSVEVANAMPRYIKPKKEA